MLSYTKPQYYVGLRFHLISSLVTKYAVMLLLNIHVDLVSYYCIRVFSIARIMTDFNPISLLKNTLR